jgi:hypothetical protein
MMLVTTCSTELLFLPPALPPAFPVRKIAHKVVNRTDADTEQGIHDHERHCRLQRSSSKRHPVSLPATSLNTFHQHISAICTNKTTTTTTTPTKKEEENNAHSHTQNPRGTEISTGEHNRHSQKLFLLSTRMLRKKRS